MLGETKGSAMRQTWGKALGKYKKHAVTGAAILGGVGLAHVVHKLQEHRLPGASTHAWSRPGYSHRAPPQLPVITGDAAQLPVHHYR